MPEKKHAQKNIDTNGFGILREIEIHYIILLTSTNPGVIMTNLINIALELDWVGT